MIKSKSLIVLAVLAIACAQKSETIRPKNHTAQASERNFDFIWNAKQKNAADMDEATANLSDSLALEFIYPHKEIISGKDSLFLLEKLKSQGFKIINSGRGNWMNGPRIISYVIESNNFVCRIDKLYYADNLDPDSKSYKVTERIACLER